MYPRTHRRRHLCRLTCSMSFRYRHVFVNTDPDDSCWLMSFAKMKILQDNNIFENLQVRGVGTLCHS